MSEEDNLFSRWSRRKRRVAEEEFVPTPSEKDEAASVEQEPETPEEEAALLERLNLPVPESLKSGDDFSAFMRAGVPEFLRKRALRVLWKSNPVLANLDGLNDYDDDFRSPELTQKVLATAYKVGRGLLSDKPDPEIMQDNDIKKQVLEEEPVVSTAEVQPEERVVEDTVVANPDEAEPLESGSDFSFNPKRMRFLT
jgi:hypothetical protein